MYYRKNFIFLALIIFSLACSGLSAVQSTPTALPTSTALPTLIPVANTNVATSGFLTDKGNVPAGFSVQKIDGYPLAVLIPDGWFFMQESVQGVDAFFVTRESIEEHGRFSTGLTVNIIQQDLQTTDVDASAKGYIEGRISAKTTTNVISSEGFKSDDGSMNVYVALLEATFPVDPADPVPSPEKTLIYQAIADLKTGLIYLMVFESPRATWQDEISKNGSNIIFSVTELIVQ